jgi:hypothetical protein
MLTELLRLGIMFLLIYLIWANFEIVPIRGWLLQKAVIDYTKLRR